MLEKHDEMLLCLDELGNPIEPQKRSIVHAKPLRIWHAVTGIYIFNDKEELLITKRSEKNEGNPGKWQTRVGGHVKADQTFLDAAIAELGEEVGISVTKDRLRFIEQVKREDVKHFDSRYAVLFDAPLSSFTFADGEITSAAWTTFEAFNERLLRQPEAWCSSLSKDDFEKAFNVLAASSGPSIGPS